MASKRKASVMNATATEEPVDPSDELMFLCLGGGNEVGRSCHVIQYKGKTVMVSTQQAPALQVANSCMCSWMPANILPTKASQRYPSTTISTSARSTCSSSASKRSPRNIPVDLHWTGREDDWYSYDGMGMLPLLFSTLLCDVPHSTRMPDEYNMLYPLPWLHPRRS